MKSISNDELVQKIFGDKDKWTASDIFELGHIRPGNRLKIVFRTKLIEDTVVQEFICRCAERAVLEVENPPIETLNAVKARRAWIRGDLTDEQLKITEDTVREALKYTEQIGMNSLANQPSRVFTKRVKNENLLKIALVLVDSIVFKDFEFIVFYIAQKTCGATCNIDSDMFLEHQWHIRELKKMLEESNNV